MDLLQERPSILRKRILVGCRVETAFQVWTEQMDVWWPKHHSVSGSPETTVFLERQEGGRLYERTHDGIEFDWGHVVVWEPPNHFAYSWYLGGSLERPSRVDVNFIAENQNQTLVSVEHHGPELLGDVWFQRVVNFDASWNTVLKAYLFYHESIN